AEITRIVEEKARRALHHREWGAQVVRHRAEERAPEPLRLHLDARAIRLLREGRPLERHRELRREGIRESLLLGIVEALADAGIEAEHTESTLRRSRGDERDVEAVAAGKGRRPEARFAAMIEDPLHDGRAVAGHESVGGVARLHVAAFRD